MSIELDWQVVDQDSPGPKNAPSPSTKPPSKRPRSLLLVLMGSVLLAAAAFAAYSAWMYRTRLKQFTDPVRLIAQLEAQAVAEDDREAFMALQDPDDAAWRALQGQRFGRLERAGLPEFGWEATGDAPQLGGVSLEPGGVRLDATYHLSVTQPMPGGPVSITLQLPQFYRQTPSGWVRAMPGADFWGPTRKLQGKRIILVYFQRDVGVIEPLAPRLDETLQRVCGPLACPALLPISFENTAGSLAGLTGFSYGFDYTGLKFPSPHLIGLPADAPSRDEWYRALEIQVVQALVYEAAGRRMSVSALSSREFVRWELAQAGLTGPFITPGITRTLAIALQEGAWQPLRTLVLRPVSAGTGISPSEVMVPLSFAFLEERLGSGTVARLLPAMTSTRARTMSDAISMVLDVDPAALESVWWKYLRNQAGLPGAEAAPPGGELTLLCAPGPDNFAVWRIRADGIGLEKISTDDRNASSPHWSPDGEKLVYLQDGVALVMEADTGQFKTVAADNPILGAGWLPDGRLWVNIRALGIYVLDLATGQEVSLAEKNPVWSPDGARMVYSVPTTDTLDSLWIADANGNNPRYIGRGLMPAWSPVGERLAFLSGSDFDVTGLDIELGPASRISIVDVAGNPAATLPLDESLLSLSDDETRTSLTDSILWSPDGAMLAIPVKRAGEADLLVLDADTGAVRARWRGSDERLMTSAWSPDSRYVAFQSSAQQNRVIVLPVQTGQWSALPGRGFDWSPDGRWLAVTQESPNLLFATSDLEAIRWLGTPNCYSVAWRPGH